MKGADKSSKKGAGARWGIILSICISIIFPLVSVEILMRMGFFTPAFSYPGKLELVLDRDVLFRIKPHCRPDINNYGYRDRDFTVRKGSKKRVVFLGDSFIMGLHVTPEDTLPRKTEEALGDGYEVYNMGVYSYGPDQSLLQLEKEGLAFKPDIVLLAIYPSNDFDDIYLNGIFSLDEKEGLIRNRDNIVTSKISGLELGYLLQYLMFKYNVRDIGFGEMFRQFFGETNNDMTFINNSDPGLSDFKFKTMRAILRRFRDILKKNGIDFRVIIIPSYWNIQNTSVFKESGMPLDKRFLNEDIVAYICKRESINCINLYPYFLARGNKPPLYDENDHHLNRLGHEYAAGIISRAILNK